MPVKTARGTISWIGEPRTFNGPNGSFTNHSFRLGGDERFFGCSDSKSYNIEKGKPVEFTYKENESNGKTYYNVDEWIESEFPTVYTNDNTPAEKPQAAQRQTPVEQNFNPWANPDAMQRRIAWGQSVNVAVEIVTTTEKPESVEMVDRIDAWANAIYPLLTRGPEQEPKGVDFDSMIEDMGAEPMPEPVPNATFLAEFWPKLHQYADAKNQVQRDFIRDEAHRLLGVTSINDAIHPDTTPDGLVDHIKALRQIEKEQQEA